MGPVRADRNVDNALSVVLQVWLAQDRPELTLRIEELHNSSDYWRWRTSSGRCVCFRCAHWRRRVHCVPGRTGVHDPSRFDKAGYFRYLNWVWERIAGSASVIDRARCRGSRQERPKLVPVHHRDADDVAYGLIANDVRGPGQSPAPASAIPLALRRFPRRACRPFGRTAFGQGRTGLCARGALHLPTSRRLCGDVQDVPQVRPEDGQVCHVETEDRGNRRWRNSSARPTLKYRWWPTARWLPNSWDSPVRYTTVTTNSRTVRSVAEIVHDLKANLGVDRALIRIAGWDGRVTTTTGPSTSLR